METAALAWAREQFGQAELGDSRRRKRLIALAASAASAPCGTVTGVVKSSAAREGAFRLLEKECVTSKAVGAATHAAAVRQCRQEKFAYVAIDGSSLLLRDRARVRDIGQCGKWSTRGRGLQVITALAVSPGGTPIGVCGQGWWARAQRVTRSRKKVLPYRESEMQYPVALLEETHALFAAQAPGVTPWFQLDRGYDAWSILQLIHERGMHATMRVKGNRCVRESKKEPKRYLFQCIDSAPVLGYRYVDLPEKKGRPARIAKLSVRVRKVTIELKVGPKRREHVPMWIVSAREIGHTKDPLHWRLMTTHPADSFEDGMAVIDGYTTRWRIEDFHRAWKRGVCNVENTQLRGRESILKWATILAAVAARASRLTYLAREKPDLPASEELTRFEIDAAIVLHRPKGVELGATPTLQEVVGWIAELGGFAGKYSGRPPGPTVIARGLHDVEVFARGLESLRKM